VASTKATGSATDFVNGPLETAQLAGQNCFVATLPPEKNQAAERPLRPFWPHQERTLTEIRARALAGRSRVAIQIATGGGKTRLAVEVAKNALAKGRRVAIIILRISLVDQWLRAFSAEGVDCVGVMQAVACEYVDAFVDRRERELIFERFRRGETKIISSVATLEVGIDLPTTACIIDARPTRSRMAFAQRFGRGLRASRRSGKTEATIGEKARFFAELKGFAAARSYSPGWASHKYREKFSVWPNDPRIRSAPVLSPSPSRCAAEDPQSFRPSGGRL
jgi:hypothetical protein